MLEAMDYRRLAGRLLAGATVAAALAGVSALSKTFTEVFVSNDPDQHRPPAEPPLPNAADMGTQEQAVAGRLSKLAMQRTSGISIRKSGIGPIKDIHKLLAKDYPELYKTAELTVISKRNLLLVWSSPDANPIGAPVVILTAMDVVEPGTVGWRYPAYSGAIAAGKVFGPGVAGTKGSLLAWFEALESLAKSGYKPARDIAVVVSTDGTWTETDGIAPARLRRSLRIAVSPWLIIDSRNTLPAGRTIAATEPGKAVYRLTANSTNAYRLLAQTLRKVRRSIGAKDDPSSYVVTSVTTSGSGVMNPDSASAIIIANIGFGDTSRKLRSRIMQAVANKHVQIDTLGAYDPQTLGADHDVANSITETLSWTTPLPNPKSLALGDQDFSEILCSPLIPLPTEQAWSPNEHVLIKSIHTAVARAHNLIVAATNHGRPTE